MSVVDSSSAIWTSVASTTVLDVTKAVERVRLAEDQLARRRHASCGPSPLLREITRLIAEADHRHEAITPSDLANELQVTTAAITKAIEKLETARVITTQRNPADSRSKLLVPLRRIDPTEGLDATALAVHERAAQLSPEEAASIVTFLEEVADLITRECRD
ncbi:MarR family transcriptional regulator [Microbacterium sp. NPDC008134]|uniref:MarR family transcriptional regulator n=1 Tax=Microbacterium sp. NPDC008134 TaxID=3364183 RepID=UPI0036E6934D